MNISDCELLILLLEEKNITKAAEKLYTSQSTLSYRIKSLERELGCVLFERGKTGVAPTPECLAIEDCVREILRDYSMINTRLAGFRPAAERNRTLRLGASTTIVTPFFNRLLKQFRNEHPEAEISLSASSSDAVMTMLEENALDVAVVRGEFDWKGKNALLFEEPLFLVSCRPVDIRRLPEETLIVQPANVRNFHTIVTRWWADQFGRAPQSTMEINTTDGALNLVRQDFGITVSPAMALTGLHGLVIQPLRWRDGTPVLRKTWCLCREGCDPLASEVFFDFISRTLPANMEKALSQLLK